jgi:hypothetical protein
MRQRVAAGALGALSVAAVVLAIDARPSGARWTKAQAAPILDQTMTLRLAFDRARLSAGEQAALAPLLEAGQVMQDVYELSRHHQALSQRAALEAAQDGDAGALRTLYRLFHGPIATTLENKRQAFLAVDAVVPGKNVYPWGVTKDELEAWLGAHPEEREYVLAPRTVVRRDTAAARAADLAALTRHPVLDGLHPMLRQRLSRPPAAGGFYSVPYALAYADHMVKAHGLLTQAARALRTDDRELAGYLRNRARDLLSNDYESGDASWVTGQFKNLNLQMGAYETYDDELYGVKAFHSASLLVRDAAATTALQGAIRGLQELEESLPYTPHRRVREVIPVGVYDVAADFGQARGTNTATILPNEALPVRRYGRTILIRKNILQNDQLYALADAAWKAVVAAPHENELRSDGAFYRTLWHEIGHYLGPDSDERGRELDAALEDAADALEEMKADLVSLHVAPALRDRGYYDEGRLRSVYASGIRRVLQNVKPRRDQPYQTMQLMQLNHFLEAGVLRYDAPAQRLSIDYVRYPEGVASLLKEVLAVQRAGDRARAQAFIERLTTWDERHEALAARMRAQEKYRFRLVRYEALGE